jgi:hypothetical protein
MHRQDGRHDSPDVLLTFFCKLYTQTRYNYPILLKGDNILVYCCVGREETRASEQATIYFGRLGRTELGSDDMPQHLQVPQVPAKPTTTKLNSRGTCHKRPSRNPASPIDTGFPLSSTENRLRALIDSIEIDREQGNPTIAMFWPGGSGEWHLSVPRRGLPSVPMQ